MCDFNFWGQAAIMVQKLQQQAKHYRALEIGARHTADMIDVAIGKLKTEIHKLQKVAKALRDADELAGRKRDEELGLIATLDSLKSNPMIAAASAAIDDAERARSSSSPFIHPPSQPAPASALSMPSEVVTPAANPLEDNLYEMSEEDEEDGDSEEKFKREAELEKVKADETAVKSMLSLD
ncbi:MAG TPA: hypothetical protein VFQ43_13265 [Nitrososphaera sp.]|nr:hypothetical protein [Nitrososphaera sp.]